MLLLTMVLGLRLAFLVTTCITLSFLFIMSVVWSINPLGPVGQLAEWNQEAIGEEEAQLDFGPASSYPDSPWRKPDSEDTVEAAKVSELESSAGDALAAAIEAEDVKVFADSAQAQPSDDGTRLLEQDGEEYGAVTFEPLPAPEPSASPTTGGGGGKGGAEPTPVPTETGPPAPPKDARVYVVMKYDPGNPLGKARIISAGTFVLLVVFLVLLGSAERRVRRDRETNNETAR